MCFKNNLKSQLLILFRFQFTFCSSSNSPFVGIRSAASYADWLQSVDIQSNFHSFSFNNVHCFFFLFFLIT
ncbi:unnamed protein product [Coffea canephora]|uniref:Uncharacterized protein n=1 Tax=Coffea canephora TaxID=49390 RepID=A0A068UB06_COFCA|nr:unnamed protein product [Coffea canephora]